MLNQQRVAGHHDRFLFVLAIFSHDRTGHGHFSGLLLQYFLLLGGSEDNAASPLQALQVHLLLLLRGASEEPGGEEGQHNREEVMNVIAEAHLGDLGTER